MAIVDKVLDMISNDGGAQDWDAKAQQAMKGSWKDEFLMIVLFSPVIVLFASAFLPDEIHRRVVDAVRALADFPGWYITMLMGILAAVYGLRWLIAPIAGKMAARKAIDVGKVANVKGN